MFKENLSPRHILKKTDGIVSQVVALFPPPPIRFALSVGMANAEIPSPFSSVVSLSWKVGISSIGAALVEGDFSEYRNQIFKVGIFLKVGFLGPFPKVCKVGVYT